jgi:hypothetical protein
MSRMELGGEPVTNSSDIQFRKFPVRLVYALSDPWRRRHTKSLSTLKFPIIIAATVNHGHLY